MGEIERVEKRKVNVSTHPRHQYLERGVCKTRPPPKKKKKNEARRKQAFNVVKTQAHICAHLPVCTDNRGPESRPISPTTVDPHTEIFTIQTWAVLTVNRLTVDLVLNLR